MTRSNDEDPLERLRAADPAAGSGASDHRRIRAEVDRRLAGTGAVQHASAGETDADETGADGAELGREEPPSEPVPDQLTARRRRRQPMRYAAAAVAAVLLLSGGYALGSGGGSLSAGSSADSAPVGESQAEDAGSDQSAAEAAPEIGTAPQPEPGDVDGSTGTSSSGPQRTVFLADDLPAGPDRAQVYALEIANEARGQAEQIAAALGLPGDPHEADGTWVVGDDAAAVLRLHPDGTLAYGDPDLQSWSCLPVEPLTDPDSSAGSATDGGQGSAAECADDARPAPPDAAQTFAGFLTDAGLDPDRYEIRTEDSGAGASVTATLLVGGQESDVRITGTVVADGIAAVRGSVATPAELGEYPLISPEDAVERLTDPRFFGSSGIVAIPDPRYTGSADSSSGVADPRFSGSAPAPGSSIPWPVRQVQITTAELTLVSARTSAGVLVLPSWQLTGTDADGTEGTWTVPALTAATFDFDG